MLAKGNRSQQVTDACYTRFTGSIGGPAAVLARVVSSAWSAWEYPELGMEAIWKIEVEDFPALFWWIKATISSSRFSHRSARCVKYAARLAGGKYDLLFAGERRKRLIRSGHRCVVIVNTIKTAKHVQCRHMIHQLRRAGNGNLYAPRERFNGRAIEVPADKLWERASTFKRWSIFGFPRRKCPSRSITPADQARRCEGQPDLGLLAAEKKPARLSKAADEALAGKHADEFPLAIWADRVRYAKAT